MRYHIVVAIAVAAVAPACFMSSPINAQVDSMPSVPGARFVFTDSDIFGNRLDAAAIRPAEILRQDNSDFGGNPSTSQTTEGDENSQIEPSQTQEDSIRDYLRPIGELTIDTQTPPPRQGQTIDKPEVLPDTSVAPFDYTMGERFWALSTMFWQIPDACRRPLYFEDRCLERCGCNRGYCLQPPASAIKFVWDTTAWPLRKVRLHPRTCIYAQCNRYNAAQLFHD